MSVSSSSSSSATASVHHHSDESSIVSPSMHTRKPSWFSKLTKRQALTTSVTISNEHISREIGGGSIQRSSSSSSSSGGGIEDLQKNKNPLLLLLLPPLESLIDSCRCCGTMITYPSSAVKIQCSVCRVVVKLGDQEELQGSKNSNKRNDMRELSYSNLKKIIHECKNNMESPIDLKFKPLEDYLAYSFSSFDVLNISFRKPNSKFCSSSVSGINYEEVKKFYHLLQQLPTLRPYYIMLCALNALLNRPDKFTEPSEIYWILILLDIPTLPTCVIQSKKNYPREVDTMSYEILKKSVGFLGYSEKKVKQYLCHWLAKLNKEDFTRKLELINLYISFRLNICMRQELNYNKTLKSTRVRPHAADEQDNNNEQADVKDDISSPRFWRIGNLDSRLDKCVSSNLKIRLAQYGNDWHLRSAGRLFAMLFSSNMYYRDDKLPLSLFYNTMVDYVHVKQDFDAWQYNCGDSCKKNVNQVTSDGEPSLESVIEYLQDLSTTSMFGIGSPILPLSRKLKPTFTFCQYPFLISLGAKISILEYEAKKQMERKAEEAFISSLHNKIPIDVYFRLRVRRNHLTHDSLLGILNHQFEFKKSLRVEFIDEPGIDAGGLKKEWFMLLSTQLLDPSNGLFNYNTESNLGWFSFSSIDNKEMYYLVGVILGLAIYNSTVLDLQFPQILYKKLLGRKKISLEDYIELYPISGGNLAKLLHYQTESEFENLGLYFEVTYEDLFGIVHTLELIPNGSKIMVDITNRVEYVQKYVNFFLNHLVFEQCKSFKNGFDDVIGGNALSLFDSGEIELLLIGDDSSSGEKYLDTSILKVVTKYQGGLKENSDLVEWFWDYTNNLNKPKQKQLLQFITGSDRLPATGIQALTFKVTLLNGSSDRLPLAHTCFNEICLYNYPSKEHLVNKLQMALDESEGFGIK